jgi:hypothetical protein
MVILRNYNLRMKGVIRSMNNLSHTIWEDLDLLRKLMVSVVK